jgi:hypothetical protein
MALLPLSSQNSDQANLNGMNNAIRQLNKEQVTKVFKQPGGNAIVEGRLPYEGGFGSLYADSNNVWRILIGIAPDGLIDIGVSDTGYDITTLYT